MELLIGRDSASSRLVITIDGSKKAMYGEPNSVPRSVSREHCKITITNNTYKIVNSNSNNITYINGNEIEQKSFNPQLDRIALGGARYDLNITAILKAIIPQSQQRQQSAANKQQPVKTYAIKHLERVWNHNHDTKIEFQIKERKTNSLRSLSAVISSLAMISSFIPAFENFRIYLLILGGIFAIYFGIIAYKASSGSVLFMDNLDKDFRKKYICPNPDCQSFLSYNLPYEELVKKGACPYCKSKFVEK